MPTTFKYTAKDASGKAVKGTVKADSQSDAIADLKRRRLSSVDLKEQASLFSTGPKKVTKSSKKKGEIEVFTRQLSTMLAAGIPMLEALEILADQAESPGFTYCLDCVVDEIRGGADLSRAMSAHPKVFSQIYVSMIKAGEVSGQIDVILTRLAEYLEAAAHLRNEIKSAMTYPVVSLVPGRRHRQLPDDRHRAELQGGVRIARRRAALAHRQDHGRRLLHARLLVPDLRRHLRRLRRLQGLGQDRPRQVDLGYHHPAHAGVRFRCSRRSRCPASPAPSRPW